MAYAEDLLELARHLALEPTGARQACLRRAVSTAYYALFHLLISEATLNWGRPELRSELGRFFEHGRMRSACLGKVRRDRRPQKNSSFKPGTGCLSTSAQSCRDLRYSATAARGSGLRHREGMGPDGRRQTNRC